MTQSVERRRSNRVRVAVVGLGVISKFYIDAVNQSDAFDLVGVCDLNVALLQSYAANGLYTTDDFYTLVDHVGVDAIIVTAPNHLHYEITRAALLKGKHVCCEKPLAIDTRHAEELSELARSMGLVLLTGFHRRYNKNFKALKEALGKAYEPTFVSARYLEKIDEHCGSDAWYLRPESCGGGCIIDNGSNVFDCLIDLFGPLKVECSRSSSDGKLGLETEAYVRLINDQGLPLQVYLDWNYPSGEAKDISVVCARGEILAADFLEGFAGFKESLWHEYAGIVADFFEAISAGSPVYPAGLAVSRLVAECYSLTAQNPSALHSRASKRSLNANVVKILQHKRIDRGMVLIEHQSRCIGEGEIHELVTTDQISAAPGDRIDRVGFLGFGEFEAGGVVERGDVVRINGRKVGTVLGFDDCHFPNHYNILIAVDELLAAPDIGLEVFNTVNFHNEGNRS